MWSRVVAPGIMLLIYLHLGGAIAQDKPKRVALVIGNGAYVAGPANPKGLTKLDNPVRDARAVADLLRRYGFDVIVRDDVDLVTFHDLIADLKVKASGAETALVFYAGHGMEVVEGRQSFNVLVPTDGQVDCEDKLPARRTVKLEELLEATQGARNQIVILDACRNNPFAYCPVRSGAPRTYGFGNVGRRAEQGDALLLTYSTGQKATADDGKPGEHSPFAHQLLKVLKENPHASLFALMNHLVVKVAQDTAFEQVPSVSIVGGIPEACLAGEACSDAIEDIEAERQRARLLALHASVRAVKSDHAGALAFALEAIPHSAATRRKLYVPQAEAEVAASVTNLAETATVRIDEAGAYRTAFAPDGSRVAFLSRNGGVRLLELPSGLQIAQLNHGSTPIMSISYSVDGKLVATSAADGSSAIWDGRTGGLVWLSKPPPADGKPISPRGRFGAPPQFSPDGTRLATTSPPGGTVYVWNVATGSLVRSLETGLDRSLERLSFAADGGTLVASAFNADFVAWRAADWTAIGSLKRNDMLGRAHALAPDRNRMAIANWDLSKGPAEVPTRSLELIDLVDPKRSVRLLAEDDNWRDPLFSPDGSIVATGSWRKKSVTTWDVISGRRVFDFPQTDNSSPRAFSRDGSMLATASDDYTIRIWNTASGSPLKTFTGHRDRVTNAAFDNAGDILMSASTDGTVRVWSITEKSDVRVPIRPDDGVNFVRTSGKDIIKLWARKGEVSAHDILSGRDFGRVPLCGSELTEVILSRKGIRAILVSRDQICAWDLASGRMTWASHFDSSAYWIRGPVLSPDGDRLALIRGQNTELWDATSGNRIAILHHGQVESEGSFNRDVVAHLAFSEDSMLLAIVNQNGDAALWDARTGKLAHNLERPVNSRGLVRVAFSADGLQVAATSYSGAAFVWHTSTGALRTQLSKHSSQLQGLAFSPEGDRLATASWDRTARVWEIATGKFIELGGHRKAVFDVLFSSSGTRVITSSGDETVRIWDAETGKELTAIDGYDAGSGWVAIEGVTADHKLVARDSKVYRVTPIFPDAQSLIDHALAVLPRCLTEEDRRVSDLMAEPPSWCFGKWPYETAGAWMNRWLEAKRKRAPGGVLDFRRFKDPMYVVVSDEVGWKPSSAAETSRFKPVTVKKGFVTDLASIPRVFFSLLPRDGEYAYAAVVHDWLYWAQEIDGVPITREDADDIFRHAMEDFKIDSIAVSTIYQAVRTFGERYWIENKAARLRGDKRILKDISFGPTDTWDEWRKRPGALQ